MKGYYFANVDKMPISCTIPGNCLQCYECSSLETAKCGATWAFEGTQGDQYKVECHNSATACRKHVSWESGKTVLPPMVLWG